MDAPLPARRSRRPGSRPPRGRSARPVRPRAARPRPAPLKGAVRAPPSTPLPSPPLPAAPRRSRPSARRRHGAGSGGCRGSPRLLPQGLPVRSGPGGAAAVELGVERRPERGRGAGRAGRVGGEPPGRQVSAGRGGAGRAGHLLKGPEGAQPPPGLGRTPRGAAAPGLGRARPRGAVPGPGGAVRPARRGREGRGREAGSVLCASVRPCWL